MNQLFISKTARCNNEAADTGNTRQTVKQDSLWGSDIHTYFCSTPLPCVSVYVGRCFCMHLRRCYVPIVCVCVCVRLCLCVRDRANSFMREMENTMHLKAHVNMPEQPSAQDFSHIQLFTHTIIGRQTPTHSWLRLSMNTRIKNGYN